MNGNLNVARRIGPQPVPALSAEQVGADPLAALRASVAALDAAFESDGALERRYPTPFGEQPGTMLVWLRTAEMVVHSWDVARGSGQPTDFDPELCESMLDSWRRMPAFPRNGPIGPAQPAPPDASAADRLAAFFGRTP